MTDSQISHEFDRSVASGERFEFGKNWQRFLNRINDERINEADRSLKEKLGIEDLNGKSFLDIGCGSGLFSLAAVRLGASPVVSFDYDTFSTACCVELKKKFFPQNDYWKVEQASVLDESYLSSLGQFDIVYSWGVLHHTGHMWKAIENASKLVKPDGRFFIAIYNDQGYSSKAWKSIKHLYNKLPSFLRFLVLYPAFVVIWLPIFIRDLFKGKPGITWRNYITDRGMSPWDDVVDWVGGYPFEVATPGEVFSFLHTKGFSLECMKTTYNLGCNEFVFVNSGFSTMKQGKI
jgi:2-polyprenyl-6-hydroxyphenyl methylase/3-demethylubiquinone-9 3-methyltransferase